MNIAKLSSPEFKSIQKQSSIQRINLKFKKVLTRDIVSFSSEASNKKRNYTKELDEYIERFNGSVLKEDSERQKRVVDVMMQYNLAVSDADSLTRVLDDKEKIARAIDLNRKLQNPGIYNTPYISYYSTALIAKYTDSLSGDDISALKGYNNATEELQNQILDMSDSELEKMPEFIRQKKFELKLIDSLIGPESTIGLSETMMIKGIAQSLDYDEEKLNEYVVNHQ